MTMDYLSDNTHPMQPTLMLCSSRYIPKPKQYSFQRLRADGILLLDPQLHQEAAAQMKRMNSEKVNWTKLNLKWYSSSEIKVMQPDGNKT